MMSQAPTHAEEVRARQEREAQHGTIRERFFSSLSRIPKWIWIIVITILLIADIGPIIFNQLDNFQRLSLGIALLAFAVAAFLGISWKRRRNPQVLEIAKWAFILGVASAEIFFNCLFIERFQLRHLLVVLAELGLLALLMEVSSRERRWEFLIPTGLITLIATVLAVAVA